MKKFLIILVLLLLLVGCEKAQEENKPKVDNATTTSTTTEKSVEKHEIKLEDFDEQEFVLDPEIDEDGSMECHIYFMNDKIYYYDGFGNTVRGDYTISGENILINFTAFIGEYSEKPQELDVGATLKMENANTFLVVETPSTYMLKTSTLSDGEWVFDGGEKEMSLLGFVKGYHFYKVPVVSKIDESKDWVYDAEYEKNLKAPSYVVWDETYSGDSIIVPYINIDSDYAKQANAEIKDNLEVIVKHYNTGVDDNTSYVDSCDYTAYSNENGLFILFSYGLGATDVVHPKYFAYNFNLVDGSKMDLDYYCNYIGLGKEVVEDNIAKKIDKIVREEMNGFDEAQIETYADLSKYTFINDFRKGNVAFTITNEENPAFVVDIQIPAGTGHFDTLIGIYD